MLCENEDLVAFSIHSYPHSMAIHCLYSRGGLGTFSQSATWW